MQNNPHDGHRKRLRERFCETGLNGFQSHEALELLLTYCIPKRDVNPLAHKLIDHFGSFAQVLDAAPEELEKIPGIGEYSAAFLKLVGQTAGFYQRDKYRQSSRLLNPAEMGKYCASLFVNDVSEKLYLVSLNIQGQLTGKSLICSGSLDELVIYTRDVVQAALRTNAYAVALTHNHPGGSLRPSEADVATTFSIRDALNSIDIPLLDHIIVGRGRYASMAAQGYLDVANLPFKNALQNSYMEYLLSDEDDDEQPTSAAALKRPIAPQMAAENGELPPVRNK